MMEDLMKMMTKCCSSEGKPDFENMKKFMEGCTKAEFGEVETRMMNEFCNKEGTPIIDEANAPIEKCRCQMPLDK